MSIVSMYNMEPTQYAVVVYEVTRPDNEDNPNCEDDDYDSDDEFHPDRPFETFHHKVIVCRSKSEANDRAIREYVEILSSTLDGVTMKKMFKINDWMSDDDTKRLKQYAKKYKKDSEPNTANVLAARVIKDFLADASVPIDTRLDAAYNLCIETYDDTVIVGPAVAIVKLD